MDEQGGQPLWATITTGLFSPRQSFAPLYGSQPDRDSLRLAVTKDAPGVDADGHIQPDENEVLHHYCNGYLSGTAPDTGTRQDAVHQDTTVQDQAYAGETRQYPRPARARRDDCIFLAIAPNLPQAVGGTISHRADRAEVEASL